MSIIAINGYAGSGKDLAAQLIQYHTSPCSVRNSGRYRTFNEFVAAGGGSDLRDFDHHYYTEWEVMKFAGKLKQIASILTGIPKHKFEDQEFKKTTLGSEWDFADADAPDNIMTVRMFLQKLGTDGLRDGLHTNVWVNALFADYLPVHTDHVEGGFEWPSWIITDCRFPNEAQAVKDRDGIIIRIDRPGITAVNAHSSETALDDYPFDERIVNDGSIEDLYEKIKFAIDKRNVCYP